MTKQIEVVIIGGGQAGIALSYYLTQQGLTHLVLEQGQVGETWRSQRWDSFTLNTPNWMTQLPGFSYHGDDPDGFLSREDIVTFLEQYAASFKAPLQRGVRVTAVQRSPDGNGYLVETSHRTFNARNVVLTGSLQKPKIPAASASISMDTYQIHSSEYRNPQALPTGAILVVGTGQSGFQIAKELHESGRQVYLSTSRCGRIPRRYRGQDSMWWLNKLGFFEEIVDQLPSPDVQFMCSPHIGEHNLNLRQFARQGIILLGHLQAAQGRQIVLAPDLEENLARADALASQITNTIDEYITKTDSTLATNSATDEVLSDNTMPAKAPLALDLQATGINTIIWATGYRLNFDWVQLPIFDEMGNLLHHRGITKYPGLYFLGANWLYKRKSGLLFGVGEDAAFIASAIASSR